MEAKVNMYRNNIGYLVQFGDVKMVACPKSHGLLIFGLADCYISIIMIDLMYISGNESKFEVKLCIKLIHFGKYPI